VAFDRSALTDNSDRAFSAAVGQPSVQATLQTAVLMPAVVPGGESSRNAAINAPIAKVVRADSVTGQKPAPKSFTARLNVPPAPPVVLVSASADQGVAPEFQTLVFIEATQFITSDSSVWRVQVWRVMLGQAARTWESWQRRIRFRRGSPAFFLQVTTT
jgi:hypothetical protein